MRDAQPRVERVLHRAADEAAGEDEQATSTPGGTIAHHAPAEIAARSNAFSIIFPSEMRLGSPSPRNASAVSSKIATAIVSTVLAISSGATCGSTWRITILVWPAPSARARFTYTRSRTLFTCARITRAVLGPEQDPDHDDDVEEARPPDRGDDDHQRDIGDDEEVVGDPHQDVSVLPPK